ncbi:MAG: hypothetical protein AB203_03930 [Parcubacteria bacterium C7867-008]|nr:MAG: hypothetical protein AB203_03930 [Parcubacteria bacterium C7867-008]
MKSLADLLLNHKVPGVRDAQIRHAIAEELSTLLNITIEPKQVKYKDADLVLAVPPVVKSVIKLRTEEIIEILKRRDIRVTTIK